MREVVNAIFYIASTGCQWRMLPKDFPPYSTVQGYFYEWRAMGLWTRINHYLVMDRSELEGREASPSAGVIDSQSVKTMEELEQMLSHACRSPDEWNDFLDSFVDEKELIARIKAKSPR